jgi:hypothetical protein
MLTLSWDEYWRRTDKPCLILCIYLREGIKLNNFNAEKLMPNIYKLTIRTGVYKFRQQSGSNHKLLDAKIKDISIMRAHKYNAISIIRVEIFLFSILS